MTPQQILMLLRSGYDTLDIARLLGITEAGVTYALHLAREEEYRAKHPSCPTFPAVRESPLAHHGKRRHVPVTQIHGLAKAGSVECAGTG